MENGWSFFCAAGELTRTWGDAAHWRAAVGKSCGSLSEKLRELCGKAAGAMRKSCGKAAEKLRELCGKAAEQLRKSCGKAAERRIAPL